MIMKKLILFIWLFTPLFVILADVDLSDDSDRPVARAQKVGNTIIYTDEKGNLIGKEEHRGDTIIYTDNTGKITGRSEKVGDTMVYTNLDGRLISRAEDSGSITTYTDENGNVTGYAEKSGDHTYTDENGNTRVFRNSFPSSYDEITTPPEDLRPGKKTSANNQTNDKNSTEQTKKPASDSNKTTVPSTHKPFYGSDGELLGSIAINNNISSYYDLDGNLLFTAIKNRNVCTYRDADDNVLSMAVTTGNTVSYYYPDGRIVTVTTMPDGTVNYIENRLTGLAPAKAPATKQNLSQPSTPQAPARETPQRDKLIPEKSFDMTLDPPVPRQ